jgi:hypothetical protein
MAVAGDRGTLAQYFVMDYALSSVGIKTLTWFPGQCSIGDGPCAAPMREVAEQTIQSIS